MEERREGGRKDAREEGERKPVNCERMNELVILGQTGMLVFSSKGESSSTVIPAPSTREGCDTMTGLAGL